MTEVRVPIRVRPAASRTAVGGGYDGRHGRALVVAVAAPPVDGRATEAALRALAGALGVPRRGVRLLVGAGSRDKIVAVDPGTGSTDRTGSTDPATARLTARLAELLGPS